MADIEKAFLSVEVDKCDWDFFGQGMYLMKKLIRWCIDFVGWYLGLPVLHFC